MSRKKAIESQAFICIHSFFTYSHNALGLKKTCKERKTNKLSPLTKVYSFSYSCLPQINKKDVGSEETSKWRKDVFEI